MRFGSWWCSAAVVFIVLTPGCGFSFDADFVDAAVIDAGTIDALAIDATLFDAPQPVGPDASCVSNVATFQGLGDTEDAFVAVEDPNTNFGAEPEIEWDEPFQVGMIQFPGLFDVAAVPPGVPIVRAELTTHIGNASSGTPGEVREILVAWNENTVTWNNFFVGTGDYPGAPELGVIVADAPLTGTNVLDLTASVSKWTTDPSANHGWAFVPTNGNAASIKSSVQGAGQRPVLEVTYLQCD
jgi:hypothetical protein